MTYILKNETKQIGQWDATGAAFNGVPLSNQFFTIENQQTGMIYERKISTLTVYIKYLLFKKGVMSYDISQNISNVSMPIDTGELYDSLLEFLDDHYERLSENEWEVPDLEQLEDDIDEFHYLMKQNYDFINYDILNILLSNGSYSETDTFKIKKWLNQQNKLSEKKSLLFTNQALRKLISESLGQMSTMSELRSLGVSAAKGDISALNKLKIHLVKLFSDEPQNPDDNLEISYISQMCESYKIDLAKNTNVTVPVFNIMFNDVKQKVHGDFGYGTVKIVQNDKFEIKDAFYDVTFFVPLKRSYVNMQYLNDAIKQNKIYPLDDIKTKFIDAFESKGWNVMLSENSIEAAYVNFVDVEKNKNFHVFDRILIELIKEIEN